MNTIRKKLPHAYRRSTQLAISVALMGFALLLTAMNPPRAASRQNDNLDDQLELRGYTRIGGALEFSVYNKSEERGHWLRVNEEQDGYEIESYDSDTNTILIRYNEKVGTLHLQASRIADYSEPPPPGEEADNRSSGTSQERRASRSRNASSRTDLAPERSGETPALSSQRETTNRGGSNQTGAFMGSRRSTGSSPSDPADPSTPPEETPSDEEDESVDSYWANNDSPPPLPSRSAPNYSPDNDSQ